MDKAQMHEWLTCAESPLYFAQYYGYIYDAGDGAWVRFRLWPAQAATLKSIQLAQLIVILKARQLGMTWLALVFALWQMLFHPQAEVLLFSRRDDEAVHLLDDRLKGMYRRLPAWMQARAIANSNEHEFGLSNGSTARAFPTTAGDSYTATLAIVDEADLVPDLNRLMRAVKPTIDMGGQMILLSRADKTQPQSEFKAIFRGAEQGENNWSSIFLPWHVHPGRNAAWYAAQRREIVARTGSEDDLWEQYPNTPAEALAPRQLDKRLPFAWLANCYTAQKAMQDVALVLPGLSVYAPPVLNQRYVIGADPAEGNPNSDDSAACMLDLLTGEEMATLCGKYEPSVFAAYLDQLGRHYHGAPILVERNNHGHAVLLWLRDQSRLRALHGKDGKPGWQTTSLSKALLYSEMADALRDGEVTLHSLETYSQLASIEGATLSAPSGMHDDRAMAFVLAHMGRVLQQGQHVRVRARVAA